MVFETPQIIKESVAASHIALWGEPQFTRFGMFWFTVFFGWFGAHHLMLRSPLTAFLFFLTNTFMGGYWYFFDLLQLAYTSYDDLNKYGLSSPFFVEFGIAVGMWKDDSKPAGSKTLPGYNKLSHRVNPTAPAPAPVAPPSDKPSNAPEAPGPSTPGPSASNTPQPLQRGGALQADESLKDDSIKSTAGKLSESMLKLALEKLLTSREKEKPKEYNWEESPPSAWITFFFLLATPFEALRSAIAGDMWAACFHGSFIFPFMFMMPFAMARAVGVSIYTLLFPMDVFIQGVSRPIPYIWDNTIDVNGRSTSIQRSKIGSVDPEANYRAFKPFIEIYKQGMGLAEGMLAYVPLAAGGRASKALDKFADAAIISAKASAPSAAPAPAPAPAPVPAPSAAPPPTAPVQRGGGESESKGSQDTLSLGIIGAVLAGGLLLGLSRNGLQGHDDTPPNPRGF